MKTHTRATLAAILSAIGTVSYPHVAAQQPPPQGSTRIAYSPCSLDFDYGFARCDLYVRVDGSDTLLVIGGVDPKWSPDGTRIVFVHAPYADYHEIWVVSVADPRVVTELTSSTPYPAVNSTPSWSHDGLQVAFVSDRTGSRELYMVNADGTGTTRLTNGIGFTGDYAWSPNAPTIVLGREVDGVRDLYKMNADGSNLVRLTSNAAAGRIAWAPGGTRLTFDCGSEVCSVNADGTGLTQLTSSSGFGGVFSPTEDRLALSVGEFGTTNQVALKQTDGQLIPLAPSTPGHTPEWSPGGNELIFQGTETLYSECYYELCVFMPGIFKVNADGTGLNLLMLGINPDWFTPRPGQPVASFTDQCTSVNCVFDGRASIDPNGAIVNYSWQFGDGTTGSGAAPGHAYGTAGYYTVTLTITDDEGKTSTTRKLVRANTSPVASFTVACNGPTCTFDASASSDIDGPPINYYSWSFGDGARAFGVVATHTFANGSFVVRLAVRDSAGDYAWATSPVQIVNPLPTASFTTACVGLTCTFDATASRGGDDTIREYRWEPGGGGFVSAGGGPIISYTYYTGGTYTVTLTVLDQAWQEASTTRTVTVAPLPMHVGDLEGSTIRTAPASWIAQATISLHDSEHRPVAFATVTGQWSTGSTLSCTTDAEGRCVITSPSMPKKVTPVLFTVLGVTRPGFVYVAGVNHDPDGDSDGTTIRIPR